MAPIVALSEVNKDYPLGKLVVHALRDIDLKIERGAFTAIAGPSGSGKTTLLNLIGCVDVPSTGVVTVDGQETTRLKDAQLTDLRLHKIGFIFQTFNLVSVLDCYQNVEFPLLLQGGLSSRERRTRVREMIDKVGLTPQIKQRPGELSGGQRQRVAIARALVTRPQIVLADEPTANLDTVTGGSTIELMKELNAHEGTTFIFSTHDPRVMDHARHIVKLEDGRIIADEDHRTGEPPASGPKPAAEASAS